MFNEKSVKFVQRLARVISILIVAIAVSLLGCWAGWTLTGNRLAVVSTPSMSPVLPVGSLLLVRPVTAPIKVGEVILFQPPGQMVEFAHRVIKVLPGDHYVTKGDLNSMHDPWILGNGNLRGVVTAGIPVLGRVMQALPFIVVAVLFYVITAYLVPRWRFGVALMALSVAVILPLAIYHPLVNGEVITATARRGVLAVHLVSTGILNADVHLYGSHFMPAGHDIYVVSHHYRSPGSSLRIPMTADLPWWGWGLMYLMCFSPMIATYIYVRYEDYKESQAGLAEA